MGSVQTALIEVNGLKAPKIIGKHNSRQIQFYDQSNYIFTPLEANLAACQMSYIFKGTTQCEPLSRFLCYFFLGFMS